MYLLPKKISFVHLRAMELVVKIFCISDILIELVVNELDWIGLVNEEGVRRGDFAVCKMQRRSIWEECFWISVVRYCNMLCLPT